MEKNYRAELVGVLGDPVDGNPTGVMEEAGFAHAGLNWRYITVKVLPEDLDGAMAGVKAFNMRGVNLTMPHKINVLKYMDELSEAARVIGAVNTVVCRDDGTLFGENTDGKGFVQSLADAGIALAGKCITLLGAGGAARSIGVECALAGAKAVNVINRSAARGRDLAAVINAHTAARAEYLPWNGTAGHLRGAASPRGELPGRRLRRREERHGGLRRGVQPRRDRVFEARRRARGPVRGRPGHAGQPGLHQLYPLDGPARAAGCDVCEAQGGV